MHRYDRPRRALAFGIAGLAGFVDATGFLAANGYFASFMSGNTTRLGVDLAQDSLTALTPALLIAGFVIGVTIGALLAERAGERRKSRVIGFAALLLLCAAAARANGFDTIFLGAAVLAMGALNNAFSREGEVIVGVTYMTGALVRFGQGLASFLRGKPRQGWLANAGLWGSLAIGALLGATAYLAAPQNSAWFAPAAAAVLFVAALAIERRNKLQN